MATSVEQVKKSITISPDFDHMLWHIENENFTTERLCSNRPRAKGAIARPPDHMDNLDTSLLRTPKHRIIQ